MSRVTALLSILFLLCLSAPVYAQSTPLSHVLVDLLVRTVSMPSTTQSVPGNPHEAHFLPGLSQRQTPFEINKAIVGQLGTFPIGSSSGGFSFGPTGERLSNSFGPSFAERALTNGRGRFDVGMNIQRLEFDSFEGADLNNVSALKRIPFVLQHNDCCPNQSPTGTPVGNGDPTNPAFEGDLIEVFLAMKVSTTTFAPFLTYGINDRWDVSVVTPIVKVNLQPSLLSIIDRVSTAANAAIHSYDGNGLSVQEVTTSESAGGFGDLTLRTKYRVKDTTGGGFAAGLDLRLPTGDKEELLGTGAVQTTVYLIASQESDRIGTHVNFGYMASSGTLSEALTTLEIPSSGLPGSQTPYQTIFPNGVPDNTIPLDLPDEIRYAVGVDIAAHPLVTVSADLIGRALLDSQRFGMSTQTFNYRTQNDGPLLQTSRQAFDTTGTGTVNLLIGTVGAKFAIPGRQMLLTANLLFPLNNSGLRPNPTLTFGLDYSFRRGTN